MPGTLLRKKTFYLPYTSSSNAGLYDWGMITDVPRIGNELKCIKLQHFVSHIIPLVGVTTVGPAVRTIPIRVLPFTAFYGTFIPAERAFHQKNREVS